MKLTNYEWGQKEKKEKELSQTTFKRPGDLHHHHQFSILREQTFLLVFMAQARAWVFPKEYWDFAEQWFKGMQNGYLFANVVIRLERQTKTVFNDDWVVFLFI